MLITTQEWDWMQWRNLGWALKNISDDNNIDLRPAFHKLSSKSNLYDEEATDKIYDVAQPTAKYRLGMQTIIGIVKESHPEQCDMWQTTNKIEWIKEQWDAEREEWTKIEMLTKKYEGIDRNDPYTWIDFDIQYRGTIYKSREECFQKICKDLKRVFASIMIGKGKHIKKIDCGDNLFDIVPAGEVHTDFYVNCMNVKGVVSELNFKSLVKYGAIYLNRFSSIDFYPGCTDDRVFNLFTGYKAKMLVDYDLSIIQPILDHFMVVVCGGNKAYYDNIMHWISSILEFPGVKTEAFLLLYSETQGTGKNSLFKFLTKYVIGEGYSNEVQGTDPLLGKFNDALMAKKLIIVDEARSKEKNLYDNFDKLKSYITDDKIWINPKGKTPFSQRNYTEFLFSTQHINSMPVEQTDRRGIFMEVVDTYAKDKVYFENLYRNFTDEAGCHFLTYAIQMYGGKPYSKVCTVPETHLRKQMIRLSRPSVDRFLDDKPWTDDILLTITQVTVAELFAMYESYMREAREEKYVVQPKSFQMTVSKRFKHAKINKKRKVLYDLGKM
jgi:hypothetical protein